MANNVNIDTTWKSTPALPPSRAFGTTVAFCDGSCGGWSVVAGDIDDEDVVEERNGEGPVGLADGGQSS